MPMTSLGFTGTRRGMTEAQKETLAALLAAFRPGAVHHGDCVGADDEAATVARELGCRVVCHPPADESHRAFNRFAAETRPARTHFARNRAIVDETQGLVAAPFESSHQPRGGTWYTVDYARKRGKAVTVIWPDGSATLMNGPPSADSPPAPPA